MDDVVYDLLIPTLSFGAVGAATGSVLAAAKARPIPRYMVATSLNFTLLGGSFITLRKLGLVLSPLQNKKPDKVWISTVAGAVTGGVFSGLMRGSKGILSAVFVYGAAGGLGEFGVIRISDVFNPTEPTTTMTESRVRDEEMEYVKESDKSVWRRLKESSPLRPIPDGEFEMMMKNKIRDLDEQIRLVDEELAITRAQLAREQSTTPQSKRSMHDST